VSCGVVKVFDGKSDALEAGRRRYPDMPWQPKTAFDTLAECYGR
jgi:hypothetical protein